MTAGAIGIVLAGCGPEASPQPSGSSAAGPRPSASPSTTPGPARRALKLAEAAFLQPPDTNGNVPASELPAGTKILPSLCGASLPGAAQRASRHVTFWAENTPEGYIPDGTFTQTISVHQPGEAAAFMAALTAAVGGCAKDTSGRRSTTFTLIGAQAVGDESLMFALTAAYPRDPIGDPDGPTVDLTAYVSVFRQGDVVTVLWEHGWEQGFAEKTLVEAMTKRAAKRVSDWMSKA